MNMLYLSTGMKAKRKKTENSQSMYGGVNYFRNKTDTFCLLEANKLDLQ